MPEPRRPDPEDSVFNSDDRYPTFEDITRDNPPLPLSGFRPSRCRVLGLDPAGNPSAQLQIFDLVDGAIRITSNEDQAEQVYENMRRVVEGSFESGRMTSSSRERNENMPEQSWNDVPQTEVRAVLEATGRTAWSPWMMNHATTVVHVVEFAAENPDNGFYVSLTSGLRRYGSLTDRQYAAVQRDMDGTNPRVMAIADRPANSTAFDPAMAADLPDVYNGVYSVEWTPEGSSVNEHLTLQIYTVLRGTLQGQRIIKRKLADGTFKGFAGIQRDGTVRVWNAQAVLRGSTVEMAAKILLKAMVAGANFTHEAGMPTAVSCTIDGEDHTANIWQSRRCRRCNRALSTPQSVQDGIGPECSGRETANDRSQAADQRSQASVPPATVDPAAARRRPRRTVTTTVPLTTVGSRAPLMSECGTAEVR